MTEHQPHEHHAGCHHDHAHAPQSPFVAGAKVGRNDPCPCGSGKKHKKCCMASEGAKSA